MRHGLAILLVDRSFTHSPAHWASDQVRSPLSDKFFISVPPGEPMPDANMEVKHRYGFILEKLTLFG